MRRIPLWARLRSARLEQRAKWAPLGQLQDEADDGELWDRGTWDDSKGVWIGPDDDDEGQDDERSPAR